MPAWIITVVTYLFGASYLVKKVMEKVFGYLREYVKKTGNVIDDIVLTLVEAIITQRYVTTGTGKTEQVLSWLLPKMTPWGRYALYHALEWMLNWTMKTEFKGDEKVVQALINYVFPEGAPERPDYPWETIEQAYEDISKEVKVVLSEDSGPKAPKPIPGTPEG